MNVYQFANLQSKEAELRACLTLAVSAAIQSMKDCEVQSLIKSPLEEFKLELESVAA